VYWSLTSEEFDYQIGNAIKEGVWATIQGVQNLANGGSTSHLIERQDQRVALGSGCRYAARDDVNEVILVAIFVDTSAAFATASCDFVAAGAHYKIVSTADIDLGGYQRSDVFGGAIRHAFTGTKGEDPGATSQGNRGAQ